MEIIYHPLVTKVDIPKLDKPVKERVRVSIENKLGTNPVLYGVPLRGTLRPLRKIRVGNYRVVFLIESNKVFIVAIAHRKNLYALAEKRKS